MISPLLLALLAAAPTAPSKVRSYDVTHYRIEFQLLDEDAFENRVTLTFRNKSPLAKLELDSYGLEITSVVGADGAALPFVLSEDDARRTGTLTVTPPRPFPGGAPQSITLTCRGEADATEHGGLFVVREGTEAWYYTQFEPNLARRFFPSNDTPSDKATTEVLATVPAGLVALSNGKKLSDEPLSVDGKHLHRVHWLQDKPHAPYLVALAVGRFEAVDVGSAVPATLWVRPGTADRAFVAAAATRDHLSHQVGLLGVPYPWDKYDQVAVPGFIWGGMENTSLVTLREHRMVIPTRSWVIDRPEISGLIAHELAHQWFGNLVTLTTWDDTWLNEGFATWLGHHSEQATAGNDGPLVDRTGETFVDYLKAEDGPRSHPLLAKGAAAEEIFDSISYTKGARVLEMLETWLGREAFLAGLRAYLGQYAYQNATSEDFFTAMGKATRREKEVRAFKEAWLMRRGYPVLEPSWSYAGGELTLTVRQRPNHEGDKTTFAFKLPITVHRRYEPAYHEELAITVDKPVVTLKVKLPAAPAWINWNRGGNALARIDASALPEGEWLAAAREEKDPAWRLLAQFALAAPFAQEETPGISPSPAALTALLGVLAEDPSPYVREAVLRQLSDSPWKRLPSTFGPVALALAQQPSGLSEDAVGNLRVRAAALELLGRVDHRPGRDYLLDFLRRAELDVNLVEAAACGAASLGDGEALTELAAAVRRQKARGTWFYRSALAGLARYPGTEVLPHLRRELEDATLGAEAVRVVVSGLHGNDRLIQSPEGVAFVKAFLLDESRGDDVKHWMLDLLDDVKTPDARAALLAVKEDGGVPDSLKAQARKVLEANFPEPAKGRAR